MFWDDGAAALNSLQKLLLDTKGDVELYRVLEDEYVLQESRQGNQELMAVLTKDENLIELTKYCLRPVVDLRLPVEERYKLSYLSTEILTVAGHNYIAEAFLKNQTCLEILGSVLDDPSAFNPVVAIFYAKLMSSLWSKNFAATMAFVKETHFLQKSLDFVRFGAIADLLESLIRLNSDEANIVTIKQYLVTEQFIPKIVALLNPDHEPAMHENAADVYVDILRNLREVLAVTDEKADVLHEVFLSETLIKDILDRMFWKDESISQQQRASLVRNGYAMISALCEQNALSPTPSQLFDAGEPEQQNSWNGGGPGESNQVFDRTKIWLPDQEKVAEIQAAKRAADIVRAIIVDMDQAETGNSWPWLLKLLNELVDTNHLPTHQLLVEGFREANFKKLFDLVYKHPLVHIYHHHVRNIVTFALFSDFSKTAGSEELSPLVDLFIKECDLFAILKNGVWPIPTIPRMTSISIRSFHIYLADSFIKAAKWAPCRRAITELVEKSEDWTGEDELSIEKGLDVYWETNRSDLLQMMKIHSPDEPSSTAGNQYCELYQDDDEDDEEIFNLEWFSWLPDFEAENTVYDIETFSRFECGQEYSDFDPATNLNSILHHFISKSPDPEDEDIDLRSHDAREGDFDQVDQFRPLADLFPPLEPRTVKIIRRSEVEESTTPQVTPTAMDTSSEEPAVADEWDAFATGRLSNGSNSSADEWGSLPTTTSSTAVDEPARPQRGSFDGMDFDQHCKEAMDCLDASVKSEEKTTDPVWDNDTLTSDQWNPFPDSQQQQLPASPAVCRHETEEETPSVQELNESEA